MVLKQNMINMMMKNSYEKLTESDFFNDRRLASGQIEERFYRK